MIQVYCYDEQGFFTISKFVEVLGENMTTEIWQGLYRQKWDGETWIETMTEAEYIATLPELPKIEPGADDYLLDLDFRLSKIELGLEV